MTTEVFLSLGRYRGAKGGGQEKEEAKGNRKGDNSKRSGEEEELLELLPSKLAHTSVRVS